MKRLALGTAILFPLFVWSCIIVFSNLNNDNLFTEYPFATYAILLIIVEPALITALIISIIENYVKKYSKSCQAIYAINKKYVFWDIPQNTYELKTNSYIEFISFDAKEETLKKFKQSYPYYLGLYKKTVENWNLWRDYLHEYESNILFTPVDEILSIPNRKLSIKEFSSTEKRLIKKLKLKPPTTTITITCKMSYKNINGVIEKKEGSLSSSEIANFIREEERRILKIQQEEAEKKAREELEKKRQLNIQFVKESSHIYAKVIELNKKYSFFDVKKLSFSFRCSSLNEFRNCSAEKIFQSQFLRNKQRFIDFFRRVNSNNKKFDTYQEEYKNLFNNKTIEQTQLSQEEFLEIEKELCSEILQKPLITIEISYKIYYISPAGRNSYEKSEQLNKEDLKAALRNLAKAQEEQKQKALEKQEREKKQAEMRELLKNKHQLDKREKELDCREKEFQLATQGHIYTLNPAPSSSENPEKIQPKNAQSLSSWEQMKLLKKILSKRRDFTRRI